MDQHQHRLLYHADQVSLMSVHATCKPAPHINHWGHDTNIYQPDRRFKGPLHFPPQRNDCSAIYQTTNQLRCPQPLPTIHEPHMPIYLSSTHRLHFDQTILIWTSGHRTRPSDRNKIKIRLVEYHPQPGSCHNLHNRLNK